VKQFPILDAHHQEVEKHIIEWLKLRVILKANIPFNSPIFAVPKKKWRYLAGPRFPGPQYPQTH
jgi:hypothetical protein